MTDDHPFYAPNTPTAPPPQPKPGELLWEFVRATDRKHFRCELRFHGESYGWETQFFEGGELLSARGGFVLRAGAIQGAEEMRPVFEFPTSTGGVR